MARIILADDVEDNLRMVTKFLEHHGHTVIPARDGHEVLALVASAAPDLVLMDMSMPTLDGWAATARLRTMHSAARLPIIALTAHALSGDRERALEVGCDEYISKPINFQALKITLARFLP